MTVSKKNDSLKKNKCIHLATIATGLALSSVSDVNADTGYTSPTARLFSAEHCTYAVDCEIKKEFAGPAGGAG